MRMVALLSNAAFDSEDTELLGAAFEAAWEKLNTAGSALAEGSEAALTRDCWRNALSRWRSGARETPIAWSRTLWIIWRDRERPRIASSRRHPLCSARRRPAVDQGRRAAHAPPSRRPPGLVGRSLDSAHQDEDENDDNNQSEAAGWVVAPTSAIGPGRQRADENQDQDNQ